jgi:sensor domain DACNV-containing protein
MTAGSSLALAPAIAPHIFPPALVPVLRERCGARAGCLAAISDEVLGELLTTVFFAGLETYEGEHNVVGVAFLGTNQVDFVIPQGLAARTTPLYQWKVQRFARPRPFAVAELVKLSVAGADGCIYSAVYVVGRNRLVISGLAREGFDAEPNPFVKIVATKPGSLSVRSGRDLLLRYERGAILTGGEDIVFSAGPVRRAFEAIARAAGFDEHAVSDYVEAVRALVREMASHGHGGILIVSHEERPHVARATPYRMTLDSSLASLVRMARRITTHRKAAAHGAADQRAFGHLLRNAFITEAERVTQELGALTAIDGATFLNCELALVAFGVILPVGRGATVIDADAPHDEVRTADFGSRGTRHRASATYAAEHPGSVVFVASEDGQVSCMFRDSPTRPVLLWRVGPADVRAR